MELKSALLANKLGWIDDYQLNLVRYNLSAARTYNYYDQPNRGVIGVKLYESCDAMHEASKHLTEDQGKQYYSHLMDVVLGGPLQDNVPFNPLLLIDASAEHRLEALGRTFNLW